MWNNIKILKPIANNGERRIKKVQNNQYNIKLNNKFDNQSNQSINLVTQLINLAKTIKNSNSEWDKQKYLFSHFSISIMEPIEPSNCNFNTQSSKNGQYGVS